MLKILLLLVSTAHAGPVTGLGIFNSPFPQVAQFNVTSGTIRGPLTVVDINASGIISGDGSGLTSIPPGPAATVPAIGVLAGALGPGVIASSVAVGSVLDDSIVSVSGSKVVGDIAGDANGPHTIDTTAADVCAATQYLEGDGSCDVLATGPHTSPNDDAADAAHDSQFTQVAIDTDTVAAAAAAAQATADAALPKAGGTMTAPILGAMGSVTAPSYSAAGQTNSGMWFSGSSVKISASAGLVGTFSTTGIDIVGNIVVSGTVDNFNVASQFTQIAIDTNTIQAAHTSANDDSADSAHDAQFAQVIIDTNTLGADITTVSGTANSAVQRAGDTMGGDLNFGNKQAINISSGQVNGSLSANGDVTLGLDITDNPLLTIQASSSEMRFDGQIFEIGNTHIESDKGMTVQGEPVVTEERGLFGSTLTLTEGMIAGGNIQTSYGVESSTHLFTPLALTPADVEGQVYYDDATDKLRLYNGTEGWVNISTVPGGGGGGGGIGAVVEDPTPELGGDMDGLDWQMLNLSTLSVNGNINVGGLVDGVDIAARDHAPTVNTNAQTICDNGKVLLGEGICVSTTTFGSGGGASTHDELTGVEVDQHHSTTTLHSARASTTTVTISGFTAIEFDIEDYDVGGIMTIAAGGYSEIEIDSAGTYLIVASLGFGPGGADMATGLQLDPGSGYVAPDTIIARNGSTNTASDNGLQTVSWMGRLNVGDKVRVFSVGSWTAAQNAQANWFSVQQLAAGSTP